MSHISHKLLVKVLLLLVLGGLLATPGWAAPDYVPERLSSNIALDSYVYGYLDKLSALGYIPKLLPSAKPYTRLQAAQWLQSIDRVNLDSAGTPAYVRNMVHRLDKEFASEYAVLQNGPASSLTLREVSVSAIHYDGDTLENHQTKSTYQPLNINNNGYRYTSGTNGTLRLQLAGNVGSGLLVALAPRLDLRPGDEADISLEAAYLKTACGHWEIQAGKDAMWWGPGLRGTRALTNNAEPVTGVKISTLEPLKTHGIFTPLGEVGFTSFYGKMTADRSAGDVQNPAFIGLRTDIQPNRNLTVGASLTSIAGGDGRELSWGDFWHFISGKNAAKTGEDKWDSIAGLDFRLRLPGAKGLQIYGELYGEDQATALGFIPTPSKTSALLGIYLPRLSPGGNWDAAFEWAQTSNLWYNHWVYKDGYVNDGNIIGDAMGWDAKRYYARFTYYSRNAEPISLHLERLMQDTSNPSPQKIDSIWISNRHYWGDDFYLTACAGVSFIRNAHYIADHTERNYLFNVSLTKKY